MEYKSLAEKLKEILKMKNEAVGIKFLNDNSLASEYDQTKKYTFCQFIMKAREGNKLLVTSQNIACANGGSALGFMPVPVVIGTHPIPMKYFLDHEKLSFWNKTGMAELAPALFEEEHNIMKNYD